MSRVSSCSKASGRHLLLFVQQILRRVDADRERERPLVPGRWPMRGTMSHQMLRYRYRYMERHAQLAKWYKTSRKRRGRRLSWLFALVLFILGATMGMPDRPDVQTSTPVLAKTDAELSAPLPLRSTVSAEVPRDEFGKNPQRY